MPNANYRKGYRVEREVKHKFEEAGFEALRSAGSHGAGDLFVVGLGSIQVKARKRFSIYGLFEGADILVVKADREEPLVVIPIGRFLELLKEKTQWNM
jgi:Holliday junction resolvase